ncbi:MAG: alkyl hydroperoxide reductase [Spirochaetaceae bacterium]|nr:alkyl hydroperoxide reductase [Spirochaetaceae bacterium]|tara:strand:- start:52501 stop:52890 length:390 start_codon:yes stop_codon:yes gene_type:complete
MKLILQLAAIYNIIWGAYVVLFPMHFFSALGMEPINHVAIWQGMGMVIGVYGVAYWLASYDPIRHWPIVAVGLLGKLLGPLGYAYNALTGTIDPAFGFTLLTNDLIWWIPFLYILNQARKAKWPLTERS